MSFSVLPSSINSFLAIAGCETDQTAARATMTDSDILIHNDLNQITEDIKVRHEKDITTADKDNPASEMLKELSKAFASYLQDPEKMKQNHIEWIARKACEIFGVDYDELPVEDQEAFKRIISRMPGARNPNSKRGKHKQ